MDIQLHNTLSGKKEVFTPMHRGLFGAKGWLDLSAIFGRHSVGMYHCGPTVYNYPHIGNLRAYVFADTLKRLMLASGYRVRQVINITDVGHLTSDNDSGEDKMEKARRREHKSAWDIAKFYTNVFFENLADMNIDTRGTKFPRATDYIREQIRIVRELEKKGFTYKTSDGIYFDTSKFPAYGKLGNIDLAGIREGQRIGVHDEKKNATDFALWKFSPAAETSAIGSVGNEIPKREMEWKSPWGVGFPGWHIECSAMSEALLGKTFDIHTGGIDHIPVHHNNEIAQSEAANGQHFVNYWMHSAFVNIEGGKMAKSADNFITLQTLKNKGYSPMDYRYFLLGARYSRPLNFSFEALDAAKAGYKRLVTAVCELPWGGKVDKEIYDKALSYVADDLDTPKALALVWDVLKAENIAPADKKATILKIDELLGLAKEDDLDNDGKKDTKNAADIPKDVQALVNERKSARDAKDWQKSDELRDKITALGYNIKDTEDGQKISKK